MAKNGPFRWHRKYKRQQYFEYHVSNIRGRPKTIAFLNSKRKKIRFWWTVMTCVCDLKSIFPTGSSILLPLLIGYFSCWGIWETICDYHSDFWTPAQRDHSSIYRHDLGHWSLLCKQHTVLPCSVLSEDSLQVYHSCRHVMGWRYFSQTSRSFGYDYWWLILCLADNNITLSQYFY